MTTERTQENGDWLERALRADAAEYAAAYLADDGFTARVMEQLPRPAALPAWRRPFVVLLWLTVAIAGIAALPVWFDEVFRGAAALLVGHRFAWSDVAVLLTVLGAVTWSALVYAARAE